MEFQTKSLMTRYGPPPPGPPQPTLTVFHTELAWKRFVSTHNGQGEALAQLTTAWATSVLLLVRTIPEGGMDLYPSISRLSREGETVDVRVEMLHQPNASMLDVQLQPWLIAEAPLQAFAGAPQIRFLVQGQPEGTVSHER